MASFETIHGSSRSISVMSALAPGFSVPASRPKIWAGRVDRASIRRIRRHVAAVIEAQGRSQHRFEPDRAVGGIGEGQALGIDILRIVRGDDDVDRAVGKRLDHRHAVVFARAAAARA